MADDFIRHVLHELYHYFHHVLETTGIFHRKASL